MGRNKPGKPRRPRRPATYTLHQLQPPGRHYEEWFHVQSSGKRRKASTDPRLGAEAVALLDRLGAIGPYYGGRPPLAALLLDEMIDTGQVAILHDDETGRLVPLDEVAQGFPVGETTDVRESLHRLHAGGAFLLVGDEEHVAFIRFVARLPEEPGDPWHFMGEPGTTTAMVCLPDQAAAELPADVLATVAYLRACEARLEEADPQAYARHDGVRDPGHARELFAAARASGYVDFKGCDACPAGHLCTAQDEPAGS